MVIGTSIITTNQQLYYAGSCEGVIVSYHSFLLFLVLFYSLGCSAESFRVPFCLEGIFKWMRKFMQDLFGSWPKIRALGLLYRLNGDFLRSLRADTEIAS